MLEKELKIGKGCNVECTVCKFGLDDRVLWFICLK